MTFNYTDKQLNNLNGDTAVYSVNSEFARRKHKNTSCCDDCDRQND